MTHQDLEIEALNALRAADFLLARTKMREFAAHHSFEPQHYLIEGLATLAMSDWAAALVIFQKATDQFSDHAQFWFNRGLAEENLNLLEDAEASYQRSLAIKELQGGIFGNLSSIYRKLGRFPEAVQMACRALAAGVPKAEALNILALALSKQGNFSEAEKTLDEALTLKPHDAMILANRANLAVDQLKFDEAWPYFAAARASDDLPVIRRDEGMARLLANDYDTGLPLYEARLELPNALRITPNCPRWQGENLSGKILLLVSEQGFGDTIQFSCYAKSLADAGASLIWTVREPLLRLLTANLPGQVIVEDEALPATDFWLPVLSLPFALGMTKPVPPAFFFSAPSAPNLPATSTKRKIGLVWGGSKTHASDHTRSIPLMKLAPLWQVIDAQFYGAFKGATDTPELAQTPVIALDHLMNDFADAAALIAQMDCVISVGTASLHLAGALNIPTYYLMPTCLDWRWGITGEQTGWYENMTILRQPRYGDWDSVIEQLVKKLA